MAGAFSLSTSLSTNASLSVSPGGPPGIMTKDTKGGGSSRDSYAGIQYMRGSFISHVAHAACERSLDCVSYYILDTAYDDSWARSHTHTHGIAAKTVKPYRSRPDSSACPSHGWQSAVCCRYRWTEGPVCGKGGKPTHRRRRPWFTVADERFASRFCAGIVSTREGELTIELFFGFFGLFLVLVSMNPTMALA